jgi:hypothetical protein
MKALPPSRYERPRLRWVGLLEWLAMLALVWGSLALLTLCAVQSLGVEP